MKTYRAVLTTRREKYRDRLALLKAFCSAHEIKATFEIFEGLQDASISIVAEGTDSGIDLLMKHMDEHKTGGKAQAQTTSKPVEEDDEIPSIMEDIFGPKGLMNDIFGVSRRRVSSFRDQAAPLFHTVIHKVERTVSETKKTKEDEKKD